VSRRARLVVGLMAVASSWSLPTAALAVFPGENGEIAYVSGQGGAPNNDSSADVYILEGIGDLTASQFTSLAGQHRHPAWSPDLTRIAYAVFNGADHELYVHEVGEPAPTVPFDGAFSPTITEDRPSWSPDGTKLAYEREVLIGAGPDSQLDIMIYDFETNTEENLTKSTVFDEGKPVWTPDGETLYYSIGVSDTVNANNFTPFDDIAAEAADGSDPNPDFIVTDGESYQPALSPDGERLCYTSGPFGSANADVLTVAADGSGTPVDLSDTAAGGYNCAWSPDGQFIAWVIGTFTGGELVYEPSDDSVATPSELAPNVDQHFDGNPDWAPQEPAFCRGEPAQIAGTSGNDTLNGTGDDDVIVAHGGRDVVDAGAGNDLVCGADGNDRIKGGGGKDRAFGEGGKDKLNGGGGKDKLDGGGGKDKLKGAGGKDKLKGRGGKDKLNGGGGKDKLNGGGGKDTCDGGPGQDKLKQCEA
jgi:dipeptidyl aminopeptidase/acylaminoacyl peptidase